MIGKTISHYKVLEKLGEGGISVVYRAQDTKLKRIVALKLLMTQALGSEEEKTQFIHEAQVVSALDHPNIAEIHEIGEVEGKCFVSMAYLEGKSLKEIIGGGRIPIRAALEIAIQVAEGLSAAHKKGVIHRNIECENIMLTKEGGIKITDFGLPMLKVGSGLAKNVASLGTIQYASPEQLRGAEVDHRSDIFSLGVVLYEMLTGGSPFKGEDQREIIHSIINEDPEPLARYQKNVPGQLQGIVDKLLQKDTKLRYQNMDEVLSDLTRLKQGLISRRPLIFRKVRPRYKTLLIPALIISFIIAVTLLVILSKYLLKPILEKKGSVPRASPTEAVRLWDKNARGLFENLSQKPIVESRNLDETKSIWETERG